MTSMAPRPPLPTYVHGDAIKQGPLAAGRRKVAEFFANERRDTFRCVAYTSVVGSDDDFITYLLQTAKKLKIGHDLPKLSMDNDGFMG